MKTTNNNKQQQQQQQHQQHQQQQRTTNNKQQHQQQQQQQQPHRKSLCESTKNQESETSIVKIYQNTMWHGHPNEPKVKNVLRMAAKSYMFLYQRLGFPNKMPY